MQTHLNWAVQVEWFATTMHSAMFKISLPGYKPIEVDLLPAVDILANSKTQSNNRSEMVLWVVSYFSLQPVLHDWCNKVRAMLNPVCGMVHIKEP